MIVSEKKGEFPKQIDSINHVLGTNNNNNNDLLRAISAKSLEELRNKSGN